MKTRKGVDLVSAWETGLAAFDVPRGDEEKAHVSDLNKCLLQVWARRKGLPKIVRSPKSRARLQKGLNDEDFIVNRLERGLGDGWKIDRSDVLPDGDLVGHLDAIAVRLSDGFRVLLEVKTTEWKESWVETGEFYPDSGKPVKRKVRKPWADAPGRGPILQALGYARRMPVNPDGKHMPYAIIQYCRASAQIAQFPGAGKFYDSEDESMLADHDTETKIVIDLTEPSNDPTVLGFATRTEDGQLSGFPPPDTLRSGGSSWMCGYCDFAGCARNVNPDGEVLA